MKTDNPRQTLRSVGDYCRRKCGLSSVRLPASKGNDRDAFAAALRSRSLPAAPEDTAGAGMEQMIRTAERCNIVQICLKPDRVGSLGQRRLVLCAESCVFQVPAFFSNQGLTKMLFCAIIEKLNPKGEVSERFKEPVLKTGDAAMHRGFESHPLRHISYGYRIHPLEKYPSGEGAPLLRE